ncbi:hypothetical protein CTI14_12520 [Methylobacterium radiotolerans]|nr:hypothetical protein CTI14_12520 [Methylobacterium radiotolerans]
MIRTGIGGERAHRPAIGLRLARQAGGLTCRRFKVGTDFRQRHHGSARARSEGQIQTELQCEPDARRQAEPHAAFQAWTGREAEAQPETGMVDGSCGAPPAAADPETAGGRRRELRVRDTGPDDPLRPS